MYIPDKRPNFTFQPLQFWSSDSNLAFLFWLFNKVRSIIFLFLFETKEISSFTTETPLDVLWWFLLCEITLWNKAMGSSLLIKATISFDAWLPCRKWGSNPVKFDTDGCTEVKVSYFDKLFRCCKHILTLTVAGITKNKNYTLKIEMKICMLLDIRLKNIYVEKK